jgi:glucosamine 6-phosphate synthetase-like amidotransferase/phosphosugar isomerase protein
MCGIVSYFGPNDGVDRVLNALELLAYRAPDSSGLAVMGGDGKLAVRRAVGTASELKAVIAADPLPTLRKSGARVVLGHGRWAMVGAVTEANTHPISDRSGTRVVCENGSHNPSLMLGSLIAQEKWWRARSVPDSEAVHRTENTSEVLTYEWEHMAWVMEEGTLSTEDQSFLARLIDSGVSDVEEQALRLAMWRMRQGNAHACAFYSCRRPNTLYVTSHNKPIALVTRTDAQGRRELMVASDVNAALMLWPRDEVESAVAQIEELQADKADLAIIEAILDQFTVSTIFLDDHLNQGQKLFARITPSEINSQFAPEVVISRYDGVHIPVVEQSMRLNPALVGKQGYPSYTELHIAEIPDVIEGLVAAYVLDGQIQMESSWHDRQLIAPGLNLRNLVARFGEKLERLRRVSLIGEGSSWRDAQAAAPLCRELLTGVTVTTYRPIEVLNLGKTIDPASDFAIEISWSGTTDSLLKVDKWLAEMDVLRLAVTGRSQSDLGRRAARSGGTIDVHTGVEVSVATVKGYEAILFTLDLLFLHLADLRHGEQDVTNSSQLAHDLTILLPQHLRAIETDDRRRARLQRVTRAYEHFNKFAVVGNSPVDVEAELKVEELAQVLARNFEFDAVDLRAIIEHTALAGHDRWRTLFIINATTIKAQREAQFIIDLVHELDVRCLIHTTPHERLAEWQTLPNVDVFVSPAVSAPLQPLIDAPFFFDLAVAIAYARGLSADEIDRPRNLAKSVTTTGAEKRTEVEARRDFINVDLAGFSEGHVAHAAWSERSGEHARASLWSAISAISELLPSILEFNDLGHLVVVTENGAMENGVRMAQGAWRELLGTELRTRCRHNGDLQQARAGAVSLYFVQAGAVLSVRDGQTIALPSDLSPLQKELSTALFLIGLAVHLARHQGENTVYWESGLAQLPPLITQLMENTRLTKAVNNILAPYVEVGFDKMQIIGGGQDFVGAASIARSFRLQGFMVEELYTDSAWHGPLATVGGPDPEHDTLILILATDPLFQAAALVDTQVYRARNAKVVLAVPEGNRELPVVQGVDASAVLEITAVPRPFLPVIHAALGDILAREMDQLWEE